MRDWNSIAWMWRCFWFGVSVGVASMMFLTGSFHRQTSTAEFVWSVTAWIPIALPDLIIWIIRIRHRKHAQNAA